MSKTKRTKTLQKRHCLSPANQMKSEKKAMKMALQKYPNDPEKAKVEAQIIMLNEFSRYGITIGR